MDACSGGVPEVTVSGSALQFTDDRSVWSGKVVLVLTVDDEPTADAASLRTLATGSLRPTLEQYFEQALPLLDTDVARADLRVVVVHPSIAGSGRAVGPGDAPALSLVTDDASIAQVDAVADAASSIIEGAVAPPGARYAPLDSTALTVQLLSGRRPPADAHEASLVSWLGVPSAATAVIIVTSQDDPGAGGVSAEASFSPPPSTEVSLISALPTGQDACLHRAPSRLALWATAAGAELTEYDTECADEVMFLEQDGLGNGLIADGDGWCLPPVASRPDGSAACVMDVTLSGEAPCAAYPGMLDPLASDGTRQPRVTAADAGDLASGRVCEMSELAGAAADLCRTSATCTGCGPGWCQTAPTNGCAGGFLRFVQGILPVAPIELHVVCDLAPG
jgi:hypothetical protein